MNMESLAREVEAFLESSSSATAFEDLALRIFAFQYEANRPYRRFCERRGIRPKTVATWDDIPAVPSTAFREVSMISFPKEEIVRTMTSSGTSKGKPSLIHFNEIGLRFWHLGPQAASRRFLFPDGVRHRSLLLIPSETTAPTLAIASGMPNLVKNHSLGEPEYFIDAGGLRLEALVTRLRELEGSGEPVALVGATFGFVHFFDYCLKQHLRFELGNGRLCDGGGFKGRSREMKKDEFYAQAREILGIPTDRMVNALGLCEVSNVYFDNVLVDRDNAAIRARFKKVPPWCRVVIVDPETLRPVPRGQTGLIRHYSLTNLSTVIAVQTDDLGVEVGDGFEILGRAQGAEAKGCSISVDELLSKA
jgi:anaerobic magnesium-protoporphyrin IX monomethyl ester cyclase